MATVRAGHQPVLLIVDVQVGVLDGAWDAERVIGNVAHAVTRARAAGVPVVWVQHQGAELPEGSPPWQWVPALQALRDGHPQELLVHKRFNSAFEETALEAELQRLQATHIVLAGAASNWCIRATAYGALERGYDLTLVADAHTTAHMDLPDGSRVAADSVVRDLNLAMTWLEYPGRRNRTASVAALDFAMPGGAAEATAEALA